MTTPAPACTREHRLDGFEPDNLLAFLALLGLLRALETARPDWRPRVRWSLEAGPPRPNLLLAVDAFTFDIAGAAAQGLKVYSDDFRACGVSALKPELDRLQEELKSLGGRAENNGKKQAQKVKLERRIKKLSSPGAELELADLARSEAALRHIQKQMLLYSERGAAVASVLSGLSYDSDGAWRSESTPLKFSSGQQSFVGVFVDLTTSADQRFIQKSLFEPWKYEHRGDSFRLSPEEARWYALSASDPQEKTKREPGQATTGEGIAPSELGANMLASLGYMSFPALPGREVSISAWKRHNREERISWPRIPMTRAGVSLAFLEACLRAGPEENPTQLRWNKARIFLINPNLATSKYKNVSRAE